MTQHDSSTLDDAFGHWFAGFIAGEAYGCRLIVGLRIDDLLALEDIQRRTGLGNITFRPRVKTSAPSAVWTVSRKAHVMELVRIFDRYPLRAKKANDFSVWRLGVLDWASVQRGGANHDWSRLEFLREQLRSGRKIIET